MDQFYFQGDQHKPFIKLDPDTGMFEIGGASTPENALVFYEPVLEWMNDFTKSVLATGNKRAIVFRFCFEYFNSSSALNIMNIMGKLEDLYKSNIPVSIEWEYEENDSDMQESGEEFSKLVVVPFNFKVKQSA